MGDISYLVNQGYAVVNDAYLDVIGADNKQLETTDFVTMGKNIEEYNLYDGFYGALCNRIAKTITYVLNYKANSRNILTDAISYGAFIQKVYVEDLDAVETPSYTINSESTNYVDPYGVTATHKITAKIFGNSATWSYEFKTVHNQLRKAVTSESEIMAFVDAQFQCAYTSMELKKESIVSMGANTGMALCFYSGLCDDILSNYNASHNKSLTRETSVEDPDFMKWANKEMNKKMRLMARPSKKFNSANYLNASPRDNLIFECLGDWAENSKVFLESGTYHADKVALSNYSEVDFWQNLGEDFDTMSEINLACDEIDDDYECNVKGIIGYARDRDYIKAMFDMSYQWSMPNPRERSNIYGFDFENGYMIEPHANAFVFYLGNIDTTTNATGNVESISLSNFNIGQKAEITATFKNSKTYSKVYYKVDNGEFVEVSATDSKYIFTIPPYADKLEIKVTATT